MTTLDLIDFIRTHDDAAFRRIADDIGKLGSEGPQTFGGRQKKLSSPDPKAKRRIFF